MRACDESPSLSNECGEGYCPTRLCLTRSIPRSRNDRKVRLETREIFLSYKQMDIISSCTNS